MTYYLFHSGQSSAVRLARREPRVVAVRQPPAAGPDDVVIRFGQTNDAPPGFWTANRSEGIMLTRDRPRMLRVLQTSGVRAGGALRPPGRAPQMIRHYQVPVFNLRALSCFRTESKHVWLGGRITEIVDNFTELTGDYDEQARKVCMLAIRAVHALGLEFALVSLGVNAQGRPVVQDIAPAPRLKGRLLELYGGALKEYLDLLELVRTGEHGAPLLGTDLEFMLSSRQNKLVLASRYFSPKGKVGCDDRTFRGDASQRPLAELRPDPARTPEELCDHIEQTLLQASAALSGEYPRLVAGSAPYPCFPIGGHIHFSLQPFTARFVNLLDVYVGLPLMLIEDPLTAARRRPRYGFLGDVRHKGYGGFEYRTPASFLVDPDITFGALALAYVTAVHQHSLPYLPLHREENAQAFYRNDRDHLLSMAEDVHTEIRRTSSYARYRDAIDPIFDMIRNDEVWDESVDIRIAWGVPLRVPRRRSKSAS